MSKAITFSQFPAEQRSVPVPRPASGKMNHRKVEDLSLKCEVASKNLKKESGLECVKAIGYAGLAVALMMGLTLLAIKVGEVVGLALCTLLVVLIPTPVSMLIGLVVAGVIVVVLVDMAAEFAVKPIFDKVFHHIDKSAEFKVQAEFVNK